MQNKFGPSRREMLFGAVAAGVTLPKGTAAFAARTKKTASAEPLLATTAAVTTATTTNTAYYSTLVNGYTPYSKNSWADLTDWTVGAGSTWNSGMDHSVRMSSGKKSLRVELRNTEKDKADGDKTGCRRAELKGSDHKLPNGIPLWGAFSFIHHPWSDPAGMATKTGGVHGQLHMGPFGGSPAVAFRRHKNGNFRVTTRGEFNTGGTVRYDKPLSFGVVHDIVYRAVMHPTGGELTVWLNGVKIVDIKGQPIGSNRADYHWNIGAYYSGGITCPVVAEYSSHVYPWPGDLSTRIANRPHWQTE